MPSRDPSANTLMPLISHKILQSQTMHQFPPVSQHAQHRQGDLGGKGHTEG